ncbi:MAG: translation initiation factor [Cyclobacteriaceae bacterium]
MGRKKKKNDWKRRDGIVYSTEDNYNYDYEEGGDQETVPPGDQSLRIQYETKGRGGKQVTLIKGFVGDDEDLKSLAKSLKSYCGVGGSAKNGEIILQGDFREKARDFLSKEGYGVR